MGRRQGMRWLLCGLVPVLALLSAHGIASHDREQASPFTVTHGSALVAKGSYAIDMSDEVAAPARITTAGQQIEGFTLHHASFDGFVLFRVDDPGKFVMFLNPGMKAAGASTYACRSATWSPDELQAIDAAPEIDLDLGKLGGALPVCAPNIDVNASAHRIRLRELPLQRVSAPDERIVVSSTLQYQLP